MLIQKMGILAEENQALRRTIRDLVALTTLPAIWAGSSPQHIAESLSDVLLTTCPHLDLVYILIKKRSTEHGLELVRTQQSLLTEDAAQKIGIAFAPWLIDFASTPVRSIPDPLDHGLLEIAVIPIGHSGNVGFVVAGARSTHAITEEDRLLLGVAANQAVIALQQAQLLADLREGKQLQDVLLIKEHTVREYVIGLHTVTAALSQATTLLEVARVIVDQTVSILKAETGTLHLLLKNTDDFKVRVYTRERVLEDGTQGHQQDAVDPTSAVADVIRSQMPVWADQTSPLRTSEQIASTEIEQSTRVIFPLLINSQVLGAIEYIFPSSRLYNHEERDFMSAVAYQCAQAVQRASLYEAELEAGKALQIRVKLQAVVAELGQEALVSFDLLALMHRSALLLAQTLEVEYTKILEKLPDEENLLLRAGVGWKEGSIGLAKMGAGHESQAGYALLSHHPVIVDDLSTEVRFKASPLLLEHQVISGVSVIIEGYERPWGILGIHSTRRRVFTANDIYFVQSVANILGLVLERARLDAMLATQRQWLTNIMATVPGVIWENHHVDESQEMKLAFISAYVETMLGYTVDEALAQPHFWAKIFHPEDAQQTTEEFHKVRRSGRSGIVNFRAVHKDGHIVYIQALMTTIKDGEKPIGKRGVMMDVSERQHLLEAQALSAAKLQHSNEELRQFAYIASHDLQEPLRMVTSYMQLLESRYADKLDNDARDFIGFAVEGAKRMKDLIVALLAYSRVDHSDDEFEQFDAQMALNKALRNLMFQIEDSGALITYEEMPQITADFVQITQLFQNLISNAIKFRKEQAPQIHIGVERKMHNWQFSVRDNGIGIAAEWLERIFVIFQRLHRKEDYPGTGIGLAICKKVVERHGGQMWAESTVGHGTTFYFTIPS